MTIKIVSRWKDRMAQAARRVDAEAFATSVRRRALQCGKWVADLDEGTGETQTEVAVGVSDPDGLTVVWIGRAEGTAAPARMANQALAGSSPALGFGPDTPDRHETSWELLKVEHAKHWSAIEKLANQGE